MLPMRLTHPFPPVYDGNSRILILGSFPSAASREVCFYYGHPRNRFWRVLSLVFGEEVPQDIEGRRAFLLSHGVALWDSIASCTITGSSDSSIRDAEPNKIPELLEKAPIQRIFCNGRASHACYERFVYPSPANAAKSLEALAEDWRVILQLGQTEYLTDRGGDAEAVPPDL